MIILKIFYWILAVLLLIKLISNLLIPVSLWKKSIVNTETGETGGVSFSPFIEVLLTLFALLVVYFIDASGSLYSIKNTLLVFVGSTVLSYAVAFVGVMLIGFLRSKM